MRRARRWCQCLRSGKVSCPQRSSARFVKVRACSRRGSWMSSTPPKIRTHIRVGQRTAATLAGLDNLEDWDDDELQRGQKRSRRGTWEGRPPKVVPKALHDELVRRTLSKAHELLRDNLVGAVELLGTLIEGEDVDDAVKLKAATIIMDRVMGKAPDKVEVTVQKSPFEDSMGKVFRRRQVIDVEEKAS